MAYLASNNAAIVNAPPNISAQKKWRLRAALADGLKGIGSGQNTVREKEQS